MSLEAPLRAPGAFHLLDSLLAKLGDGDLDCAAQLFREFEPYLRIIIRKQLSARLRAKFDSTDVLQSVWECVVRDLQGRGLEFDSSEHLRHYLVKVAQHRFFDHVRRHRGALENEVPGSTSRLGVASPQARPSEEAQAEDAWGRLLDLCPPAHHEVLRLKRNGLTLSEIAASTGRHPDGIRRILRDLARRYSSKQP